MHPGGETKILREPGETHRLEKETGSLMEEREKDEGRERENTVGWQHLLQSERPLSPLLSHNPPLPVNTTEEHSHTQ